MVNRNWPVKKAGPNEPAHKYGNLNIRPCGLDFFPKGVGGDGGDIGFVPASPEATPRQVGFVLGLFSRCLQGRLFS